VHGWSQHDRQPFVLYPFCLYSDENRGHKQLQVNQISATSLQFVENQRFDLIGKNLTNGSCEFISIAKDTAKVCQCWNPTKRVLNGFPPVKW